MSRGDAARTVPASPDCRLSWSGVILVTEQGITGTTWNQLSRFNSSCPCSWTIVTPPAHNLSQLCRCLFPSANPAAAPLSATDCHPLCVICPTSPSILLLLTARSYQDVSVKEENKISHVLPPKIHVFSLDIHGITKQHMIFTFIGKFLLANINSHLSKLWIKPHNVDPLHCAKN